MAQVKAPDGTIINFPDSMKDSDIEAAMGRLYPASASGASASPVKPQQPVPEESPLSKAWGGLKDTLSGAAQSVYHAVEDPVSSNPIADQAIRAGTGPAIPLARMLGQAVNSQWDQAKRAGQDVQAAWERGKRGQFPEAANNLASAGEHAAAAMAPIVGPTLTGIADTATGNIAPDTQDFSKADPARATGQVAGNAILAAAPKITEALPMAGKVTLGAAKGAVKGAFEPVAHGVHKITLPASLAGAATGGFTGEMFGHPEIGAAAGAAYPIVRGAIRGAKEALHGPPDMPPPKGTGTIKEAADGNLYRIGPDNTAVPIVHEGGEPMKAPVKQAAPKAPKPKAAPPLGRTINPQPEAPVYPPAAPVTFRQQPQAPAPPVYPPPAVRFREQPESPTAPVYPAPPVKFRDQPAAPAKVIPPPAVTFRNPPPPNPNMPTQPTQNVPPTPSPVGPSAAPGSVVIPPAEGMPPRYGDIGGQFGSKMAADAYAKDVAIAKHLTSKGITPDQLKAASDAQRKSWAREANPKYKGINPERLDDLINQMTGGGGQ